MIYLDSAATTLQKPPEVLEAVNCAMRRATTPGRGGHRAARLAAEIAFRCREQACALFGVSDPEQVVFTMNATHALNLAIRSAVRPGDTVIVSGFEHNAVTRPLAAMENVTVRVAQGELFQPRVLLCRLEQLLEQGAQAVVCTHVSNVFGYILPMDEIARLCRRARVPLIVDASQSAGCVPVDMSRWQADFVAMPGHKGLYGPQGTGLLLCGGPTRPLLFGGTGSHSREQTMPDFLPDRLEAGTHNVPGIAGLLAGLRFVQRVGVERIGAHEQRLIRLMTRQLERVPGIQVFAAPEESGLQSGVLSVRLCDRECEQVAETLGKLGFAVRSGMHCAPAAHRTAGTLDTGTVRLSVCAFTTEREVLAACRALARIAEK